MVAITDEEPAVVAKFRARWKGPFFDFVAIDGFRKTFIAHGVSGTPTIVLVDENGVIRLRQVGYTVNSGLNVNGWRWTQQ